MRDVYWHGEVTRISPEAPVPVISVKRVEEREGAAANVAANVRAMGVPCYGYFGNSQRVEKIRLVVKGRQEYRVDFDHQQEALVGLPDTHIPPIVIFVDYGKGTLSNVQDLIREAKEAGSTVLVDPKGYDYERYMGADVLKPNLDEMRVVLGGWKDDADLDRKANNLLLWADVGAILLTRASDGMSLYTRNRVMHIQAVAKEVIDVTGAGESAIAALGVGLHRGLSLEQSVVLANKAAGVAVGKFGPYAVTEAEL
jgi:rfaE bifunctional protein kinase chain/domain